MTRIDRLIVTVLAGSAAAGFCVVRFPSMLFILPIAGPYVLALAINARRGIRFYEFSLASVILLAYTLLFPLRLYSLSLQGFDGALIFGNIGAGRAIRTTALAGAATTCVLLAYALTVGRSRVPAPIRSAEQRRLRLITTSSLGLAVVGLATMMLALGGPLGIYAKFASHQKGVALAGAERLGYTLWSVFLPLGLWVVLGLRGRRSRLLRAVALLCAAAAVMLFGSRLTLLIALVGAWPFWEARRGTAALKLGAVAVALLAISLVVVADRTQTSLQQGDVTQAAVSTASYSVLDAATAVRESPDRLRDAVVNPERFVAAIASFVPSVLWGGKPSLQEVRLDSAVAFAYGSGAQRVATGFPTSFLTEGLVVAGLPGVVTAALVFGALVGCVERSASSGRLTSRLAVAAGSYTTFTYYKDGDLITSSTAGVKLLLYALLLLAFFTWLERAREPIGTHSRSRWAISK